MSLLHKERLAEVHPDLVQLFEEAALEFRSHFDLAIVCGFRTQSEQRALYAKGRTEPGKIVTNARSSDETAHGRGGAVDFCPVLGGKWLWDDKAKFELVGGYAEARGFVWGGRFSSPIDLDHVEVKLWRDLPPDNDKTPPLGVPAEKK